MLGHGFTCPVNGQPVDIPAKLAHLERLTEILGFERFVVSGSSYGALIGVNLYFTHPERVTQLIINGSGSCFNSEQQLAAFVDRIFASYKPNLTCSTPEMWRERLAGTVLDVATVPPELPALLALCYAQPWAEGCWEQTVRTMQNAEAFRPFRVLERLEAIAVKSLVVWGRNDKGGIYESAVAAVERMPSARLVAFEQCGHLPMLEQADGYNRVVRSFLGEGE
jgi:pimeloyl-ACP methyl ester carboxylesterase